MISSGLKVWFLAAIVVTGVYVLPSVVATFAGSHTLELNLTKAPGERILDLKCGQCHQYIVNEVNDTTVSTLVGARHYSASANTTYMAYVANMTPATSYSNMCKLCHYTNDTTVSGGTHTVAIVRPCTWSTCHGNSTDYAQTGQYAQAGQVGRKLGNTTEVHSRWFKGLELEDSNYMAPDNTIVDKSYYACLGCHSHVGIDFNITRLNKYSITINKVGGYTVNATVNLTSSNVSISSGPIGTKWN